MKQPEAKRYVRKAAIGCLGVLGLMVTVASIIALGDRMAPEAQSHMNDGNLLFQAGRFDEAEDAYLQALAIEPGHPAILAQLGAIALYRNDTGEAERYFTESVRNVPWYRNFWPLSYTLHYRLGLTYLREDRLVDAAAHFERARGPVAVGPFRPLDALAGHYALFAAEVPYRIDGPDSARINFVATDPLPVVEVSVNGSKPRLFIVDTGGMEVILDDDLAQQVGAKISGTLAGSYGGGKTAETGLGQVDSLTLGDYLIQNVPVHILDTGPFSSAFEGLEIAGVIGTRLLMHFLTTIDYPGGALLLEQVNQANLKELESRIAADEARTVPFWLIDTHYMVAWGTINDQDPSLFFVDTGLAGVAFTAPLSVLEDSGVAIDWSQKETGVGGGGELQAVNVHIDRLTLGSGENQITKTGVAGVATEQPPDVLGDQLGVYVGGLISHQFFRAHALTLDFTGMRLVVGDPGRLELD